ncbi:hypothetical protein [Aquipseudomonas guryensis]|jgi:hypothetical protein|uniref:Uncharacterized protein n=1 Tax=Aquipseudomonas guryensis TaxID=2759165 RepID=A0A7W4H5B7_9GAMM|nr:hypothetical protein [Pseudomonas guryensis]MBB1521410.1 hypothetical protein [Pseudomonas guryensis]
MEQNNPYAAPQVALVDQQAPQQLQGWSAGQLQVLGWLCLVSLLASLVDLVLVFVVDEQADAALQQGLVALGLVTVLLGTYVLLRFKGFAEQRFNAHGLTLPVWLSVIFMLVLEGLDLAFGDVELAQFGWPMFVYFGLLAMLGGVTLWLGIRLLQVKDVYPVFRVMAWMEIVGGGLLATILLMVLAVVPLVGATLCMMLVFFRGAEELRGQPAQG